MKQANKTEVIALALMRRSLNRFEAERIGDHCLHTTISDLSKQGWEFERTWEEVPTRWSDRKTRVKRYKAVNWPAHWNEKATNRGYDQPLR